MSNNFTTTTDPNNFTKTDPKNSEKIEITFELQTINQLNNLQIENIKNKMLEILLYYLNIFSIELITVSDIKIVVKNISSNNSIEESSQNLQNRAINNYINNNFRTGSINNNLIRVLLNQNIMRAPSTNNKLKIIFEITTDKNDINKIINELINNDGSNKILDNLKKEPILNDLDITLKSIKTENSGIIDSISFKCIDYRYKNSEMSYKEEKPNMFDTKYNPTKKTDFITTYDKPIKDLYNNSEYPFYFDNNELYLESIKPKN